MSVILLFSVFVLIVFAVWTIQVWVTPVGFPSELRQIYPDSRIAGICSKLGLPVPPKLQFIIAMFLDIHQNLALVVCTLHLRNRDGLQYFKLSGPFPLNSPFRLYIYNKDLQAAVVHNTLETYGFDSDTLWIDFLQCVRCVT